VQRLSRSTTTATAELRASATTSASRAAARFGSGAAGHAPSSSAAPRRAPHEATSDDAAERHPTRATHRVTSTYHHDTRTRTTRAGRTRRAMSRKPKLARMTVFEAGVRGTERAQLAASAVGAVTAGGGLDGCSGARVENAMASVVTVSDVAAVGQRSRRHSSFPVASSTATSRQSEASSGFGIDTDAVADADRASVADVTMSGPATGSVSVAVRKRSNGGTDDSDTVVVRAMSRPSSSGGPHIPVDDSYVSWVTNAASSTSRTGDEAVRPSVARNLTVCSAIQVLSSPNSGTSMYSAPGVSGGDGTRSSKPPPQPPVLGSRRATSMPWFAPEESFRLGIRSTEYAEKTRGPSCACGWVDEALRSWLQRLQEQAIPCRAKKVARRKVTAATTLVAERFCMTLGESTPHAGSIDGRMPKGHRCTANPVGRARELNEAAFHEAARRRARLYLAMRHRFVTLAPFALFACGGGEHGPSATGDGGSSFDACRLMTKADATTLFEAPAEPEPGPTVTDPKYVGDCSWKYETPDGLGMKVLSLNVWGDPAYYAPGVNAEPFDIGDQGSVLTQVSGASDGGWGVDVSWTQGEITASLGYFAIRAGIPDRPRDIEAVKALALTVSDRL
jgi:hypothetical protein